MLAPGVRIVRGPDWTWGNQDGGEGHVGTVCEIGKSGTIGSPDKTVVIQWDNGRRTNYRVGYMGMYDLRVIDNAQIGIKHPNIGCDGCDSQGISGMRYKCAICNDYDLCYACYHGDKHDLTHPFKRFETPASSGQDLLTPRFKGRKCELFGIFAGAKVVRGFNWEWDDQDGGEGKIGRVLDIRGWDKESNRSVANVHWFSGSTNVYRLGHKGICDIKFVEPSSGGTYYPEHLPVLGLPNELTQIAQLELQVELQARRAKMGPLPFGVGDKVQVSVTLDELKVLQQGHGGWNPRMAEYTGKIGSVHRITEKGDIRVQYEGCNNRWTFNPQTLKKINSFTIGDIVTLISDLEKVKELQKGHGEWIEIMKNSLGKLGKVTRVYTDGDLRVQLDGHEWTLNPQCVRTVPGSAAELANTMHANQNQRQEPTIRWHPGVHVQGNGDTPATAASDQFVRAAAQGNLEAIKRYLHESPCGNVDTRSNGKTALQVAAHQGQAAVVKFLLRAGASVNSSDTDGDTCLHYAAFGNQPEVIDLLIKSGADLNSSNTSGCTPLHVAAHKNPARCAQLLLSAGADPNKVDLYGDTALHDAIGKDCLQVIDALCVAPGTDFTLRNKRGFNVLHHSALKGKNMATQTLLRYARQLVDVKKDDGFSALHLAALNGHRDVVETLVRMGQADIDLRNNRNQTALLLAVSQGHCDVIELLINLKANINATDEDDDSALHILIMKRSHLRGDVDPATSPAIHTIYQRLYQVNENTLALAIACFLIQKGINTDLSNNRSQTALSLLQETALEDVLRGYIPVNDNDLTELNPLILPNLGTLTINEGTMDNYNLTDNSPAKHPAEESKGSRRSRQHLDKPIDAAGTSQDNSPTHKSHHYQNEVILNNPNECLVCSEISEENVTLEPCGHKPACEDCSARMKKCFVCGEFIQKRLTKDGRSISVKSRQPSAERMRYLESKIAEIEESHACSICMERKRNVVFLCGHGTCQKCADTLKTCHMCRKTITKKISIY